MNISRDTRIDRRRRVLRDASLNESPQEASERSESRARRARSSPSENDNSESLPGKRSAGYSQDVRQACGTRLVQFIPVRLVSFFAVMGLTTLIVSLLLTAHYLIYVNGKLDWYGHHLAVALDATHPQSIAAWLGSHLWLLCLISTTMTFQLRRHKLDDYTGEYRLWFWLVATCLLASLDSTTHLSELLGASLDNWAKAHFKWSGIAMVHATMAVLVGLLGIRLVSELKAVPWSLVCWLTGLCCWAASAALSEDAFRVDHLGISLHLRYWLRAAFWLGGLTLIWFASLAYLRHVYMEAQRRFLLRNKRLGRTSQASWPKRIRESLAVNPLAFLRLKNGQAESSETLEVASPQRQLTAKSPAAQTMRSSEAAATTDDSKGVPATSTEKPRWPLRLWPGRRPADDDAQEYCKVRSSSAAKENLTAPEPATASANKSSPAKQLPPAKQVPPADVVPASNEQNKTEAGQPVLDRQAQIAERNAAKEAKRAEKAAQREAARQARLQRKQSGQGWNWKRLMPWVAMAAVFSKMKLPSLSGLKLSPPEPDANSGSSDAALAKPTGSPVQGPRPVNQDRPLPNTLRVQSSDDEDQQDDDRQMSRAERKRLRRQGRAA